MYWLHGILTVLFGAVAFFMMLLILLQKGRGGGLSSAFGGAGGNTAFGTKTGDVFTWATAVIFAVFLLLSMALVWSQDSVVRAQTATTTANPDALGEEEEVFDEEGTPELLDSEAEAVTPAESEDAPEPVDLTGENDDGPPPIIPQ